MATMEMDWNLKKLANVFKLSDYDLKNLQRISWFDLSADLLLQDHLWTSKGTKQWFLFLAPNCPERSKIPVTVLL